MPHLPHLCGRSSLCVNLQKEAFSNSMKQQQSMAHETWHLSPIIQMSDNYRDYTPSWVDNQPIELHVYKKDVIGDCRLTRNFCHRARSFALQLETSKCALYASQVFLMRMMAWWFETSVFNNDCHINSQLQIWLIWSTGLEVLEVHVSLRVSMESQHPWLRQSFFALITTSWWSLGEIDTCNPEQMRMSTTEFRINIIVIIVSVVFWVQGNKNNHLPSCTPGSSLQSPSTVFWN